MGMFGWSIPPGCSFNDLDEAVGANKCKHCEKFAELGFECSVYTHGECDCPKCQGFCECNDH